MNRIGEGLHTFNLLQAPDFRWTIRQSALQHGGEELWYFIDPHLAEDTIQYLMLATSTKFNLEQQQANSFDFILNLKRINDIRYINKFFESANALLLYGGVYIGCVQTTHTRKKMIISKYPAPLNWMLYSIDFALRRVMPKINLTKRVYFYLTQGHNRLLSKAETLGRLFSCGFDILETKEIDNHLYFVAQKIQAPAFDTDPSYGPLIRLRRVGKNGQEFNVLKLRTMHPYSEYLQDYVYRQNSLEAGGKFKDDFRVTTIGKIFRKFWIDELPMFVNVFRGQMKLVGVRPLSKHYLDLYSEEVRARRIKYKPGLVPPFYADLPKTLDEIMASEMKYLDAYDRLGWFADFQYFGKALYNILVKKARSK